MEDRARRTVFGLWGLSIFATVTLLLLQAVPEGVSCESDKLSIEMNDRQSDVERVCADFLLIGRLTDFEGSPPPQCQDYVNSYLKELDHGRSVNTQRECSSFLINAEMNNIQGWLPPPRCEGFIKSYMDDGQYEADVQVAVSAARSYLRSFTHTDEMDAIVLDIDETALSNMPYYREHRYGVEKFQKSLFNQYVSKSEQPALMAVLSLYQELRQNGWSIIFITGRDEESREATSKNLQNAGYDEWAELILRQPEEAHETAVEYKSNRRVALEKKGYRIRTSIGDQWSDLEGFAAGARTFKLPNPMYYIF
ncbi:unnamed protein product [Calypogeia fissa]